MIDQSSVRRFSTGSAGEREAHGRFESSKGACLLRPGILDVLRFVEHEPTPVDRVELLEVAMHEAVGRYDEVVTTRFALKRLPLVPVEAVVHEDFQAGRERSASFRQLPTTDVGQIRRNGRSSVPASCEMQHQREHLNRLPESHVVGEASAEPVLPEEQEPGEALNLVRAERPVKRIGGLDVGKLSSCPAELMSVSTQPVGACRSVTGSCRSPTAPELELQDVSEGHLRDRRARLNCVKHFLYARRGKLDPAASHAHEGLFQLGELEKLIARQVLPTQRDCQSNSTKASSPNRLTTPRGPSARGATRS